MSGGRLPANDLESDGLAGQRVERQAWSVGARFCGVCELERRQVAVVQLRPLVDKAVFSAMIFEFKENNMISELVRRTRTVRRFQEARKLDPSMLRELLDLARLGGSARATPRR